MFLTEKQQDMLAGKYGEAVAYSMKIQVGMGRIFNATRMVVPGRVHVAMGGCMADYWFANKMLNLGGKCVISPTTNPSMDFCYLNKHLAKIPDDWEDIVRKTNDAYTKLGATMTLSCTPYLQQNVPAFGEILAFSESSATPYVNSVYGARSNRESSQSALCAAITGLVPEYGLLLEENRKAEILVEVQADLNDDFDYQLLGWSYPLKYNGPEIPVFSGIEKRPNPEGFMNFGAQLNTSGAVAMYHIEGITPEAPDLKTALNGKEPKSRVVITNKDFDDVKNKICGEPGKIDFALFGCPHWSLSQIADVCKILNGRKFVVDVWILTSFMTKELAARMGYQKIINEAGGHILADTCVDEPCWWPYYGKTGVSDSPKCMYYDTMRDMKFKLRSLKDSIEAAIAGEVKR
ncbi:MAG: aconitase X catalytic domain-containing protein [Synergistaceae bacterium]|nr:aconitase X catalytic domain-containing protein [Synergistaceae bacterium]